MKAIVVERPGELSWREVGEPPPPGSYQALARVSHFALCNATDKYLRDCVFPGVDASTCPLLLGHECVGEVVATGPHVRYLQPGDRVLRPMLSLPDYGSYWGGFAEYGLVTDLQAYKEDGTPDIEGFVHSGHQVVPEPISSAHAVVLITFKEVMSYCDRLEVGKGSQLLIIGHGPVGLSAVYLARNLSGAHRIVVAGRRPEAEEQVLAFGADGYVDTRQENWPAQAVELLGAPADSIYDTTGNADIVQAAVRALAPQGIIGSYASRPHAYEQHPLPQDERLIDARTDEGLSHDRIVNAVLRGVLEPQRFVTHILLPEQIDEGFRLVEQRQALKIVFSTSATPWTVNGSNDSWSRP